MTDLELTSKLCSYEILVFNNDKKFLAKFATLHDKPNELTLLNVWFGSLVCKFDYIDYTGCYFSDKFKLKDFLEWKDSL